MTNGTCAKVFSAMVLGESGARPHTCDLAPGHVGLCVCKNHPVAVNSAASVRP